MSAARRKPEAPARVGAHRFADVFGDSRWLDDGLVPCSSCQLDQRTVDEQGRCSVCARKASS